MPGATIDGPAATVASNNRLHIVVRGMDGKRARQLRRSGDKQLFRLDHAERGNTISTNTDKLNPIFSSKEETKGLQS